MSISTARKKIGAMARALAVFRDDKLKAEQMAKALEIAQDELIEQAKLASLGGIVAGVAHEVNTPIGICVTAITKLSDAESELSTLLKENKLTEKGFHNFLRVTQEACKIATTNLQRAAQLIRSFKGIAVDQASEEPRQIELGSYVTEALTSLRPELRKRGLTIELECPDKIEIETIPSAIWQIISNLVLNAQVHAFDPGMIGSVQVRIWAEGNNAHMTVSDNGKGMKEEVRARIFEPFFTTKRGSGGSGLGLTIVYNLVTQTLGGRITCKSKLNRGTEFTIRFPLRNSDRVDRRSHDPVQSGVSEKISAA
jgi:two-component system NtrC family sensor kinase